MKPNHPRRVPEYLQHILDAIDRATSYVSGMDFSGFEGDTRTQDAVIRSIEIIGEAANKTRAADPDFAARHAHVLPSKMMADRDQVFSATYLRLTAGYSVWQIEVQPSLFEVLHFRGSPVCLWSPAHRSLEK